MPLLHSKSKKAFEKNLKTELGAGKPKDQSLAIAYSVQRQSAKKRMSAGGIVPAHEDMSDRPKSLADAVMKKRRLAKGGFVEANDEAEHGVLDTEVENYDDTEMSSVVDNEEDEEEDKSKSRADRARARMKMRGAA